VIELAAGLVGACDDGGDAGAERVRGRTAGGLTGAVEVGALVDVPAREAFAAFIAFAGGGDRPTVAGDLPGEQAEPGLGAGELGGGPAVAAVARAVVLFEAAAGLQREAEVFAGRVRGGLGEDLAERGEALAPRGQQARAVDEGGAHVLVGEGVGGREGGA
jgi:hypothetical protein